MGSGSWDPGAYRTTSSSYVGKATASVFASRSMKKELDPLGVAIRESRDSKDNPASSAVAVFVDVTGSMGVLADKLAREGLGTLFGEILSRKPVTDPHMMFGAIGDVHYDRAPLQVSQFEADNRIVEQLTGLFLEGGGGGNRSESYHLPWYFAAMHTSIDCFEKRGKKGYLFTMGDEEVPDTLTREQIKAVFGDDVSQGYSAKELLAMAEKTYHVFHLMVEQGQHMAGGYGDAVVSSWTALMGQRAMRLSDYTKMSEVIVSTIQVTEGADAAAVVGSWKGGTELVVARAIGGLTTSAGKSPGGVHRF